MKWHQAVVVGILLAAAVVHPQAAWAQQEYAIGEGDLLKITVYDNADLTTEARVNDGKITFPLIGEVYVNDLTVSEIEKIMSVRLADGYLKQPQVSVFILEFKKTVYVNGEVRNPGSYKLTKGLTVLKAITLAGGLTSKAAEGRTKIIRKTDKGEVTIKAKLDDLVEPDDIITVPESWF
ncbi:MAG: polysaccharide export protein [Nitrospiraceae bacterium]|nr:polysaccharide export protein [Nitrospiraceae bacterium]